MPTTSTLVVYILLSNVHNTTRNVHQNIYFFTEGGVSADLHHRELLYVVSKAQITLFSFVDCHWCLLAKRLLAQICVMVMACFG